MSLREKQAKFLEMDARLVLYAADVLHDPIVCLEWLRSREQQAINVARGASKTMNSKHLLGLAKDYCFLSDLKDDGRINYSPDKYRPLGEYWESLGGRWGGRFGDIPQTEKIEGWDSGHFEYVG